MRFLIPNTSGRRAYVRAVRLDTGKRLWEKTVFRVKISPDREEDVQWIFIARARLEGNHLVLVDERDRVFRLNIMTRSVQAMADAPPDPFEAAEDWSCVI